MKPKKKLNVLVACEYSGVVRDAFRRLGHKAYSCDILPCDPSPYDAFHLQGDVLTYLEGRHERFRDKRWVEKWDLMIAHPPCTYLCNSGVRWLLWRCRPAMRMDWSCDRWAAMQEGAAFFKALSEADIPHIAVENPIPHKYAVSLIGGRKYDQIIQPWQFGHGETKATCLWLKNLPPLVPTDIVSGREHRIHKLPPGPDRAKIRSRTFEGIADAMARQWSEYILKQKTK